MLILMLQIDKQSHLKTNPVWNENAAKEKLNISWDTDLQINLIFKKNAYFAHKKKIIINKRVIA